MPLRKLFHYALANHRLVGCDVVNACVHEFLHLLRVVNSPNVNLQSQFVSLAYPVPMLFDVPPRMVQAGGPDLFKLARRKLSVEIVNLGAVW